MMDPAEAIPFIRCHIRLIRNPTHQAGYIDNAQAWSEEGNEEGLLLRVLQDQKLPAPMSCLLIEDPEYHYWNGHGFPAVLRPRKEQER